MVKNINQDRDNATRGELLKRQDQKSEIDRVYQMEKPKFDTSGNPEAKSMWSTGRGCPKCKNQLAIKEYRDESETLVVYCNSCRSEFMHQDLESTSEIGDSIHRQIPDILVLKWMNARKEDPR